MMEQKKSKTTIEVCCRGKPVQLDSDLGEVAALFKVLGDETRLAVLRYLHKHGETCACQFLDWTQVAQPTLSHHLKVLRDAGLVTAEKRGLWVRYSLDRDKLEELRRLIP